MSPVCFFDAKYNVLTSENSALIQIYVPESRHSFPMSLCKKTAFLSYKVTGVTAVKKALAPCCMPKLWLPYCQMEPAATLSGPVFGSNLSDERQMFMRRSAECMEQGAL